MVKLIDILQTKHELDVPNTLIQKIYNMIIEKEIHNGDGVFNDNSRLDGEITLANPTYEEWVNKINEVFPYLIIHTLYYILFQDKNVETMMINYLLSKGVGDCIGITEDNAKDVSITQLPSISTNIEYFNELPKFERIKTLSNFAFSDCNNLKEIDLSNIESTGKNIFNNCANLDKIKLGKLTSLTDAFFAGCIKLKTIIGTSSITSIGNYCFQNCQILENIDLSNITSVGNYCFSNCLSLQSIGDVSNLITIGSYTFVDCKSLQSIGNTPNLITIGNNAFVGCSALTSFDFNTNINTISNYAFQNCTSLIINDLNLPNLISLGYGVFSKVKVKKISSLGNITVLPADVFANCSELINVNNNALNNIVKIEHNAFYGCSLLQSIGNISNILTIEQQAFQNCKQLTSIDLPQNITSIGAMAFSGCTSLVINNLNLPNLSSLGIGSFTQTQIKEISSLGNLTSIKESTFNSCKQLTKINNNALSNITRLENLVFNECRALTDIGDTSNLEYIGNNCFYGCSVLQSTIDLSHVTYLGGGALKNCTNLKAKRTAQGCIDMTSLEELGGWAFDTLINDFTGYIDFGTHLTKISPQNWSSLNANLIVRSPQVPTMMSSSGWSYLGTKSGYYCYVPDELLDTYKTTFSIDTDTFKPISELPAELQ